MQYTEQELQRLISDVEKEFTSHLAKAEENFNLAKSEDGEKKPEKKPEGEKKPEKKPEGEKKPEAHAEGGEKAPEGEAKPEGAPAPEGAAPAAAAPAAPSGMQGAGHDYDAEDMEHMKKMYMSMSEQELKAHHDCIASIASGGGAAAQPAIQKNEDGIEPSAPKNSLGAKSPASNANGDKTNIGLNKSAGNNGPNGNIEECAPCNALGAKSADSDAHGDKINVGLNKGEAARRNGGKIEESAPKNSPGAKSADSDAHGEKINVGLHKSEGNMEKSENELLKAENEKLQKTLDTATAILTKLVEKRGAPAGKAITSLEAIAKSEGVKEEEKPLTQVEINSILNKKAADPKLEKSDRDAINAFYLGDRNLKAISHLLK
jgi:hypothetical protein